VRATLSRFQRYLRNLLESPRAPVRIDYQSERFVYLNVHARPVDLRAELERNLIEENPDSFVPLPHVPETTDYTKVPF
jgi:hypothetical protein